MIRFGGCFTVSISSSSSTIFAPMIPGADVSAVRSLRHIGSIQIFPFPGSLYSFSVMGILAGAVDRSLAAPVRQIMDIRGIHHIVQLTESFSSRPVVRAENINSVPEYMRLSVRNIFVKRKLWIKHLFQYCHPVLLLPAYSGPSRLLHTAVSPPALHPASQRASSVLRTQASDCPASPGPSC